MGTKRQSVELADPDSWVFNSMVEAYRARPAYPEALVELLCQDATDSRRWLDVGAGIGHLCLPLNRRGVQTVAIEPAESMLRELRARARLEGCAVESLHAAAEQLPFDNASFGGLVIADAMHFINVRRAGPEFARVLAAGGAFSVIVCSFADTPFMRCVGELMSKAAPRRQRQVGGAITELFARCGIADRVERTVEDSTELDADALRRVLRSVSFIGPAMNPERWRRFSERLERIEHPIEWARRFTIYSGRRRLTKQFRPGV